MRDILASFRRLPIAVQIWVGAWLGPINIASLAFLGERNGGWIAALVLLGMAPNMIIMAVERGLSALMALPHLIVWTPAVVVIAATLVQGTTTSHAIFLALLLITDVVSLIFDVVDFKKWLNGDRAIA